MHEYLHWKLPLHPANVLLANLPCSYLGLHLSCFGGALAKHEQTWGQAIQSVNCPQILEPILLSQDEDYGIMPVPTTRMHRDGCWLVDNHQVICHRDDLDLLWCYRHFMSVDNVSQQVVMPELVVCVHLLIVHCQCSSIYTPGLGKIRLRQYFTGV